MAGLKILHIADVHLGAPFRDFGSKGALQRNRLIEIFSNALDLAVEKKANMVLICGDLFDNPNPSSKTLDRLNSLLSTMNERSIPVVIIPGNHDPWGNDSIYKHKVFNNQGISLLTPEDPVTILPELNASVCGWFPDPDRPEEWLKPDDDRHQGKKFRIGMAHGPVHLPGLAEYDMPPIPAGWIEESGLNYLALGHWHQFKDVSAGKVSAFYPGSIEMLAINREDAGNVLMVSLDSQAKAGVEKIKIGRARLKQLKLDAGELTKGKGLEHEISSRADPDLFLDIAIEGPAGPDFLPDLAELLEDHQDKFLKLRIRNKSRLLLDDKNLRDIPDRTVAGEFIAIMREKIGAADSDEQRADLELALKLGMSALMGPESKP